jgi:hypothetical protein
LFDGENIYFDASLVIYINTTNIPPIMITNRIYEHQNLLSLISTPVQVKKKVSFLPFKCSNYQSTSSPQNIIAKKKILNGVSGSNITLKTVKQAYTFL